jgi:hypothetical protein
MEAFLDFSEWMMPCMVESSYSMISSFVDEFAEYFPVKRLYSLGKHVTLNRRSCTSSHKNVLIRSEYGKDFCLSNIFTDLSSGIAT